MPSITFRFWKKSFFAVFAAAIIVSVYFITGILMYAGAQYNAINTGNLEEAVKIYGSFTPDAVFTDRDTLTAWASRLGESGIYRVTLINRSGQVLFDTVADSFEMENHLDRAEFQGAITNGIGSARRKSATLGQDYIYAAMAIKNSNNVFAGVIRVSMLVPGFFSRFLGSTLPFLLLGVIVILGACVGIYHFSRRLSLATEAALDAELEKKRLELKAKTEEAETEDRRREVILNSMFDGVIALDKNLKIILANPRLCSLFGAAGEKEALGQSLLSFSRSAELEEAAQQVLLTGRPSELILKRYISAVEQHLQVFAAPLKIGALDDVSDGVQGVVIVMNDITRIVKLESIRKDFAANVSHELRTPIQVIKGFAENILNSPFDDKDEALHFVEIIAKNAQTMENLTNDLMTLVSIEDEGRPRPQMEDCALAPLIAEAAATVEVAARKKNITIEITCPPELSAKLYGSLIIQALVNLLDNGVKYSRPDSKIRAAAFREDEGLVIEVRDKGIGIPAEHLGRLFERFYRVDRSRSREEGGTGLGLAIVRHIALLHNGSAEVESRAGEGSVFRLWLPC